MPWAAAVAAVGAIGGAVVQSNAAGKAAKGQADASQAAIDATRAENQANTAINEQNRSQAYQDQLPYRQAGNSSLNELMIQLGLKPTTTTESNSADVEAEVQRFQGEGMTRAAAQAKVNAGWNWKPKQTTVDNTLNPNYGSLSKPFDPSNLENTPGYQFRLGEGTKQINHAAAARGNYLSGATIKALTKYGQDFASNEYANEYNRYTTDQTNKYNRLASTAGLGQISTPTMQTTNVSGQIGNYLTGNANAQGASLLAQGSAYGGAANTLGGLGYNALRPNTTQQPGTVDRSGTYDPNAVY